MKLSSEKEDDKLLSVKKMEVNSTDPRKENLKVFVAGLVLVVSPYDTGAVVVELSGSSPPTKANRIQSPVGPLTDFRKWLPCQMITLHQLSKKHFVDAMIKISDELMRAKPYLRWVQKTRKDLVMFPMFDIDQPPEPILFSCCQLVSACLRPLLDDFNSGSQHADTSYLLIYEPQWNTSLQSSTTRIARSDQPAQLRS
ncbi:hypothetical protein PR048_004118 [Dryococelus australis]|uniref:Uncharacterized protein n=1 Tax=Dryococelus australis TaxID=614101 RepID=A0ABQ9I4N8_9NEOP|nr:hypothetical protein PR048_004118 [Dryococelus australis]